MQQKKLFNLSYTNLNFSLFTRNVCQNIRLLSQCILVARADIIGYYMGTHKNWTEKRSFICCIIIGVRCGKSQTAIPKQEQWYTKADQKTSRQAVSTYISGR